MNRRDCYAAWAPHSAAWSGWTKPVLFSQIGSSNDDVHGDDPVPAFPEPSWIEAYGPSTVTIVNLRDDASVRFGLALARHGVRPVPLFDNVDGEHAMVPMRRILRALEDGAHELAATPLDLKAPPAFLLDADRLGTVPARRTLRPLPGSFDNRWMVFPEDFPSGAFLTFRGFERMLVVQENVDRIDVDLTHVLKGWQDAGLAVLFKSPFDDAPASTVTVSKSRMYQWPLQRVLAVFLAGFRRDSTGAFGSVVPEPLRGG